MSPPSPITGRYQLGYSSALEGILATFIEPNGTAKTYSYSDGSEAHGIAGLLASASDALGTRPRLSPAFATDACAAL